MPFPKIRRAEDSPHPVVIRGAKPNLMGASLAAGGCFTCKQVVG
jgi:hypothetical protein